MLGLLLGLLLGNCLLWDLYSVVEVRRRARRGRRPRFLVSVRLLFHRRLPLLVGLLSPVVVPLAPAGLQPQQELLLLLQVLMSASATVSGKRETPFIFLTEGSRDVLY